MKKQLILISLLVCGLALLSSCMKDDPKENETVFYGHQQIPNINEFMPQRLLFAMGNENLHFGDEPPRLEGSYLVDSIIATDVILIPESHWIQTVGPILGIKQLKIHEQHFGIAKLKYDFFTIRDDNTIAYIEGSDTDSTFMFMKEYIDQFTSDTIAPVYFDEQGGLENFNTVYIMGKDPYFTIFYYDIRYPSQFCPLYANIISGRVEEEAHIETDTVSGATDTIMRPVIKDLIWGIEQVKYFNGGHILDILINQEHQVPAKPGDIVIIENLKDIHQGEILE